ncbi:MAG TPA: serine acetyltransferase [Burkholderiales bacterium]|nr:serine acetyltransferase [Burkholderiales bacterium]
MQNLRADFARVLATLEGRPVYRSLHALCAPGFQAVLVYRFGRWVLGLPGLARWPLGVLYQLLYLVIRISWGIEIPRAASIGPGLYVGHFGGIAVSRRAVIGRNCALSQQVTIGVDGSGERSGAPLIGDDVYLAPGARVFGRIRIGNNVKIGPNAVVGEDIPDDAVVALDPGYRIVSQRGNRRASARPGDERRSASTA